MPRPRKFDTDAATHSAMDVFWREGFAAASPAILEKEMGIGRSSLYNTFGSKDELYRRALDVYVREQSAELIAVLQEDEAPLTRIRNAINHVVELSLGDADRRGCLVTNAAIERAHDDDEVRRALLRVMDDQEAEFAAVLREGIACGRVESTLDPEAFASLLVATLNGIRVVARVDPSPTRLAAMAENLLKGVSNGSPADLENGDSHRRE